MSQFFVSAASPLVGLAPMAGYSDLPFRAVATACGADFAVAEMVSANPALTGTRKSSSRLCFAESEQPRIAQIAGSDPAWCADAARRAVDAGADVVDINMGCPVKKVCNKLAGSALLKDEALVGAILEAVVAAVAVPVTLKTRTGWSPERRNAITIARIAEAAGIRRLALHGRTRDCRFRGEAEYDTIRAVTAAVSIPVLANGDLDSAAKVQRVLAHTGAAGVLIGRAAVGNPWLFAEVAGTLDPSRAVTPASGTQRVALVTEHLAAMHDFYGDDAGHRIARKHMMGYLTLLTGDREAARAFNALAGAPAQRAWLAGRRAALADAWDASTDADARVAA